MTCSGLTLGPLITAPMWLPTVLRCGHCVSRDLADCSQMWGWLCFAVLLFEDVYLSRRLPYIWSFCRNNFFLGLLYYYWSSFPTCQLVVSSMVFLILKEPWDITLCIYWRCIISGSQRVKSYLGSCGQKYHCEGEGVNMFPWLELLSAFCASRRIALLLGFCVSNINHFTVFKGLKYFPEKGIRHTLTFQLVHNSDDLCSKWGGKNFTEGNIFSLIQKSEVFLWKMLCLYEGDMHHCALSPEAVSQV